MEIAEQVLLPAVRRQSAKATIVADGFSCRRQIEDGAGRRALHPAELIAAALRGGPGTLTEAAEPEAAATSGRMAIYAAGTIVAAALAWKIASRLSREV
jgi:hypothetical protein